MLASRLRSLGGERHGDGGAPGTPAARSASVTPIPGVPREFARLVHDALAHVYDPAYLRTHPLARRLPPDRQRRAAFWRARRRRLGRDRAVTP
jgi:hypothetical protein